MDSMDSVVRIHSTDRYLGTGFLVHRTNDASFVMTCLHVIKEFLKIPGDLRICFPNEDSFGVSIVKEDASTDLALLRYPEHITSGSPRALQISPLGKPYVGPVELIAYFVPNDSSIVPIRPGISTGLTVGEPTTGGSHLASLCDISNTSGAPGASGGPLMTNEKVIGVLTSGSAGIRFSIMAKDIYATLRKWSKATKKDIEISVMLNKIAAETATASSSAPTATASSSKQ